MGRNDVVPFEEVNGTLVSVPFMPRPPVRPSIQLLLVLLLVPTVLGTPAAAQRPETGVSPLGEVLGAVLTTVVVGGGFILLAAEYTDRTTRHIREKPVETFLYGFGIAIVALIALVVLFVSVIGVILAIPLAIAMLIVSEIGYLAVGRVVTESWGFALLIAVGASAIVGGVPIVGTLLGMVLSSFGFGAAYLEYRDDGRPDRGRAGKPS